MTTPERLGKYEIVEVLGKGAMGVVYRAFDPDIHRTVAIKTIRKELVDDQERAAMMFARFKNEARAAGRLSHPGIVAVHDYGDTGAVTYIAMEFVQGMSLRDYFNRGTRFQERDIVSIMAQLLEALQHAHEQGVWHRDIKPANLIVMNNGRVKIADFGIAKVETSQLTQTGLVMGSPGYMAPEQYTGGGVDWRADLFAAGVVMYQLLTGVRAFAGTTEQMAYKICHTNPPPVSESDPGQGWERYDAVMTRALAKEPDARFQTAESFRAAILEAYAAPVSPTVSEATIIAEATRPVVVFEPSNPSARTFPDQTPPPLARPIPPAAPALPPAAADRAAAAGAAAGNPKFAHKLDFVRELRAFSEGARKTDPRAILVGDLNIAPLEHDVWSHKKLLDIVSHTPVETKGLMDVIAVGEWGDAMRLLKPEPEKVYSWWSYRSPDWETRDLGRRLDHVWLGRDLTDGLKSGRIFRETRGWERPSDHVPVRIDLEID